MQARFIFLLLYAFSIAVMAVLVGNVGHVILERSWVLLWLVLAWGQKVQFAVHLPVL
jgi:hypothetical protein